MLRNVLALALFSTCTALGGCHLYFDEGDGGDESYPEMWPDDCSAIDCGPDGERPDEERPDGERPDEEPPPLTCETDEECAAGCYCSDEGVCEESSLCRLNQDCGEGFHCSEAGSCVPDDEEPGPLTCDELSDDEAGCLDDEACSPVYRGVNCTSDSGEPCTSESANCTCESFSFDSCVDE